MPDVLLSCGSFGLAVHAPVQMNVASRTAGKAPLAVWFDALKPDGGVMLPANYKTWRYDWDFGDPASGVWDQTTGRPRNTAHGFVACHVYERPGTYIVTLQVRTDTGVRYQYVQQVTVTPFAHELYVDATGGDDGYAGTQAQPIRTLAEVLLRLAPDTAVYFKRGESWTVTGTLSLAGQAGPLLFGAYGTGAAPRITRSTEGVLFDVYNAPDIRFVDLYLSGVATNNSGGAISAVGKMQQVTALRLEIAGSRTPFGNSTADALSREICIADCQMYAGYSCILYLGGYQLALLGSVFRDCPNTHIARIWHAEKSVFCDCHYLRPGATRQALKLHADTSAGWGASQFNLLARNTFTGDTFVVALAPQDTASMETVADTLFEQNLVQATANTQPAIYLVAQRMLLRNNILNGNGASRYFTGVRIAAPAQNPTPEDNHIVHNTIARTEESVPPGAEFTGIDLAAGGLRAVVRNNIFYAPPSHQHLGGCLDHSTDSDVADNHYPADPLFVDPGVGDFHLQAGSPALGYAPAHLEVYDDFNGHSRARAGAVDAGAF